MKFFTAICLFLFAFSHAAKAQISSVDLLIINANVRTMDEKIPRAEAIAVGRNKIIFVGKTSEIKKYAAYNTIVIDAKGKTVIPGFNDSHVHILGMGNLFSSVDLRFADSPQNLVDKIKNNVRYLPKNRWILGGGWNNENWSPKDLPNKILIDSVTPDNPVFLYHSNPKIAFVNSAALKLAGVNEETKNPLNGEFVRDKDGKLTGVLKDSAVNFVRKFVPDAPTKNRLEVVETATNYAAAFGVTSMQDMSADDNTDVFRQLEQQGKLKTRIYDCIGLSEWLKMNSPTFADTKKGEFYRQGCLKYFTESFPESIPELSKKVALADKNGWQIMIHSIGGAANNVTLSIFENVIKENGKKDRRLRVEHAHGIRAEDIARFGRSNIIASMQPALFFGGVFDDSEPYKSLLSSNAKIAFGSDSSMIPINPFEGIYAAVMRDKGEKNQSVSVEEAVRLYTLGAAFAEFQEASKGSIAVGKLADFIILSDDIFSIRIEDIPKTKILATVMNGKIVYESK